MCVRVCARARVCVCVCVRVCVCTRQSSHVFLASVDKAGHELRGTASRTAAVLGIAPTVEVRSAWRVGC